MTDAIPPKPDLTPAEVVNVLRVLLHTTTEILFRLTYPGYRDGGQPDWQQRTTEILRRAQAAVIPLDQVISYHSTPVPPPPLKLHQGGMESEAVDVEVEPSNEAPPPPPKAKPAKKKVVIPMEDIKAGMLDPQLPATGPIEYHV